MTDIDQKIEILYDLLIDNFETLESEIKDLISKPEKIKDTNKFASLLSNLNNSSKKGKNNNGKITLLCQLIPSNIVLKQAELGITFIFMKCSSKLVIRVTDFYHMYV